MNMRTLIGGLSVTLLATCLSAQANLLKNGDFESPTLAPWVEGGYSLSTTVSAADTTGVGASRCYNCLHGGKSGQTRQPNGYWPGNTIEQPVLQVQGLQYVFTADLMVTNIQSPTTSNADAGLVELFIDGKLMGSYNFGSYVGGTTERARVCIQFTAAATNATARCAVQFSRRYYSSNRTPTIFIDNAALIQSPHYPLVCPVGERKVNTASNIELHGTANARCGLFVALSKLPGPVSIPGFAGRWALGSPMELLFITNLDAQGQFAFKPTVPVGAKGIPIYWQAIQQSGSAVEIGELAMFGFY